VKFALTLVVLMVVILIIWAIEAWRDGR